MMDLQNRSVLVLGGGKSGVSAVKFCLEKGCSVALYDGNDAEKPVYNELRALGCEMILGELPDLSVRSFDFAVISPGIPLTNPCAVMLRDADIPIWGELELASRFIDAPIIGITGTNGKTTTTSLIGEIFKNAGHKVFVGGNIGVPLLEALHEEYDYYVVEMSSFQLETIDTMDVTVSVVLNLTPDHLDRHGDMEGYLEAKGRLVEKQSGDHFAVLNYDDPYIRSLAEKKGKNCFFFSRKEMPYFGVAYHVNGLKDEEIDDLPECYRERIRCKVTHSLVFRKGDLTIHDRIMDPREIRLPGPHNLENAMAAITAARLMDIPCDVIRDTLMEFAGVEHRLEDVRTLNGVRYVNDSKGTNPDSVFKALASYGDAPIVLLAGGRNKGNCFDDLAVVIREKCRDLILMGEAAEDMRGSALKAGMDEGSIHMVADMAEGVALAHKIAVDGDVVLLSPANASFDQFKSFEHRGEVFKALVNKL
ncbi:MAG: UDP-N-acetylmuramoyl-L-alanine--D-glutamate ligase [Firmicutes bacterium]|nr:UDP-N-acetylmuramoyl-L-alanine--D-glutamate ligase [Bacillota bacterium]